MGVEKKRGFVKVAVSKAVVRLRVSTRKASAVFLLFPFSSGTWLLELAAYGNVKIKSLYSNIRVDKKRGFVKVAVSRAVVRLRVSSWKASTVVLLFFPSSSSSSSSSFFFCLLGDQKRLAHDKQCWIYEGYQQRILVYTNRLVSYFTTLNYSRSLLLRYGKIDRAPSRRWKM